MQHENCVTIWSPGGTKSGISRDLLKIFEFCKMCQIANNTCNMLHKGRHGVFQVAFSNLFSPKPLPI